MALIKCPICGGDLELEERIPYASCPYCSNVIPLPDVRDEHRANLFLRGEQLLHSSHFDQALSVFESIIDEDPRDAEAHWNALMAEYGIEYVEDPVSHERIPTCHRVQETSILRNVHCLAALQNADNSFIRELYEKYASAIAKIQKEMLRISSQESPFDIFICYKETSEGGQRTQESILGQDIYEQLCAIGYKVFFARISLEGKLGSAYEPIIFAALNSSKVMLVLGTSSDNFNAVWVKNEWGRFLDLMKQHQGKVLIPCYYGMDPYQLPEELKMLQSVDMGKIGFFQDLELAVRNTLRIQTEFEQQNKYDPMKIEQWLNDAEALIKSYDYSQAGILATKVLDMDAKNAKAYLLRILVKYKTQKIQDIDSDTLKRNEDYAKLIRFADETLMENIKGTLHINKNDSNTAQDHFYFQTPNGSYVGPLSATQIQAMIDLGTITKETTITNGPQGMPVTPGTFRYSKLANGREKNIKSILHIDNLYLPWKKIFIFSLIVICVYFFSYELKKGHSEKNTMWKATHTTEKFAQMFPKRKFPDAITQQKECEKLKPKLAEEFDKIFVGEYAASHWSFTPDDYIKKPDKWDTAKRREQLEPLCKIAYEYAAIAPDGDLIYKVIDNIMYLYDFNPKNNLEPTKQFRKQFKDIGGFYEINYSYDERLKRAYYESLLPPYNAADQVIATMEKLLEGVPRPYKQKKQKKYNAIDIGNGVTVEISAP